MKKILAFAAGLLFVFSMKFVFAKDPSLEEKINQVIQEFAGNTNIGVMVQEAKSGQVLYQKNINRYFTPASNQKLLTAFAALQFLGPDFRFQTQLFADYKKIKHNSLRDDLRIHFSGDPSLTITQFDLLLNSLLQAGILEIKGNILIDDTAFDQMFMSPGSAWDDEDFCWGAPLSALIFNGNCAKVLLKPALQAEQPAVLELPNFPQTTEFVNQVITYPDSAKNCAVKVKRTTEHSYTLSGCIKVSSQPQLIERAVLNPQAQVESLVKTLLAKNQIKWQEHFEYKPVPINEKPFALQESPPLKDLVTTMLKESDNTIADAIFKTIGAKFANESGSYKNGSKAVRTILQRAIKLSIAKNALIDGSGTSRYNFLTPQQLVFLLQKVLALPIASDFLAALPISGVDGTLKDRMKVGSTLGKVVAKTGTETGVTSLSGYLKTNRNQTLLFSILINGFIAPSSQFKILEDKICQVLVEAA